MSVTPFDRLMPAGRSSTEIDLRRDLAAAYRIIDYFGWTTLIFGHLTVRLPGPQRHFLINPFGLRYDEVTASNLLKIDLDGNLVEPSEYRANPAGFIIHGAVHEAREDITAVMHIHTIAGSAVAAAQGELPWVDFHGAGFFYNALAYHDFAGVHADNSDRGALVADLGDKHAMILRNHGLLTCGKTIAGAFNRLHALQIACEALVAARSMNVPLTPIPDEVARKHAAVIQSTPDYDLSFRALVRLMEKRDPSFLN